MRQAQRATCFETEIPSTNSDRDQDQRKLRSRKRNPKIKFLDLKSDNQPALRRANTSLLVVDDDPSQLEYFSATLKRAGFRVFSVNSTDEALTLLRRTFIDVVICDANLPGHGGVELLRTLRTVPTFPKEAHIPILFLTTGGPDIEVVATSLGVDGFCLKEEHPQRLLDEVESLVNC